MLHLKRALVEDPIAPRWNPHVRIETAVKLNHKWALFEKHMVVSGLKN